MRILNYPRLLAVIGLCGLANLAGLSVDIGNLSFISFAHARPAALTTSQSDALNAYNKTVQDFRAILSERRAQINSHQKLPDVPGQALYLARVSMMGAYKDLTDVLPSKIGRPNKYKIPPAYFDADNEPLIDEYKNLFAIMQAPPANAQKSETPFKDVVDLGHRHCADQGPRCSACRSGRPHQSRRLLCRDRWPSEHRQCALEFLQRKFSDRGVGGQKWSEEMGGDQEVCRSPRSQTERSRRQGRSAGRQFRSAIQSLDRRAETAS